MCLQSDCSRVHPVGAPQGPQPYLSLTVAVLILACNGYFTTLTRYMFREDLGRAHDLFEAVAADKVRCLERLLVVSATLALATLALAT